MSRLLDDPVRLGDQHDQLKLVERIAGQAARDLADRARLSSTEIARMADPIATARVYAARTPESRRSASVLVMVMGAFLLGIVTAASAAHLDWLPRWIIRSVHDKPKPESHPVASGAAKARPVVRTAQSTFPVKAAAPGVSVPFADPIPEPVPTPVPAAKAHAKKRLGDDSGRTPSVAMLDDQPGTSARVTTGHPSPHLAWPVSSSPLPPDSAARHLSAAPLPSPAERRPPDPAASSPGPLHQGTDVETPGRLANLPAVRAERSSVAPLASIYLKEIVRALRIDRSPSQALALLDQHASELAGNAFAEESLLLRVEAMLALGQRASVLRLLDRTSLTDVGASRGLLITRGELRAAANRCAEGIGDFDLVLAEARRPPKKALLGRALCKQKLGDTAGATADFDRFRREFPNDPLP